MLVQAEDELASINMIDRRLLSAACLRSPRPPGPGLSLMTEALGLAVAAEVPDRGGRRDARRTFDRHSGEERAERRQHRGQRPARRRAAPGGRAELDRRLPLARRSGRCIWPRRCRRRRSCSPTSISARRARSSTGPPTSLSSASARSAPARRGRLQALRADRVRRLADGDSGHAGHGLYGRRPGAQRARHSLEPVGRPRRAARQAREESCMQHDYGEHWADIEGEGDIAVVTFGSCTGAAREALARAAADGHQGAAGVDAAARARRSPSTSRSALAGREARAGGRAEPRRAVLPLPARASSICRAR